MIYSWDGNLAARGIGMVGKLILVLFQCYYLLKCFHGLMLSFQKFFQLKKLCYTYVLNVYG